MEQLKQLEEFFSYLPALAQKFLYERRIYLCDDDRDEMIQDARVHCYLNMDNWDPARRAKFSTYMFMKANSAFSNYLRTKMRRNRKLVSIDIHDLRDNPLMATLKGAMRDDAYMELVELLEKTKLSAMEREVVMLRYYDYSFDEIAWRIQKTKQRASQLWEKAAWKMRGRVQKKWKRCA